MTKRRAENETRRIFAFAPEAATQASADFEEAGLVFPVGQAVQALPLVE